MTNAKILSQRPFNIADEDRYLVIITIKNIHYACSRFYKNKPILTTNLYNTKTYNDFSSLEKVLYMFKDYDYNVYQVKNIFEPRYFLKFINEDLNLFVTAKISSKLVWSLKIDPRPDTFIDYVEAQKTLNIYKCRLLEHYHKKIMELTHLNLQKIKS